MVADATLFLWNRCKSVFQKVQTGASDSVKYLQKIDQPNKVSRLKRNIVSVFMVIDQNIAAAPKMKLLFYLFLLTVRWFYSYINVDVYNQTNM